MPDRKRVRQVLKVRNPFLAIDKRILGDSGTSGEAARCLDMLCNRIGPRFAGSEGYRLAAEFMLSRFRAYKMDRVYLEPFKFLAWRRGDPAILVMTHPRRRQFGCYQFPYSKSTGAGGVEATVVDIGGGSQAEVRKLSRKIRGKIVITNGSSGHRSDIYARCARAGAAGFVLSAGVKGGGCITGSLYGVKKGAMPAVSVSLEDGIRLRRAIKRGGARFRLATGGRVEEAVTWNVIGELRGNSHPGELVIMGGHLDSHEIGPGAFDNAAGAVTVMEAARLLARQKKHLKRTVRFIGFAAEEVDLLGSRYHAAKHAAGLRRVRFMLNSDCPSMWRPKGLVFHKSRKAELYLKKLEEQMETPIVYKRRYRVHSDHYPFMRKGVTTASLTGGAFGPRIHHCGHMAGDTADKISITDLRDGAAFSARMLLRAANDDKWLIAER